MQNEYISVPEVDIQFCKGYKDDKYLQKILGRNKVDHKALFQLPINGLSEVIGIISDTVLRNMVNDRRIVTPENGSLFYIQST